jgi:tRNA1Val (adenine37-N6)-methyltransferase
VDRLTPLDGLDIRPDETADTALGGAVPVIQPQKGYRFSVDSILLARFAAEKSANRAADLGCGCGVVALCLLRLGAAREVVGLDIQEEMVDRARRAAIRSAWRARASFVCCDMRRLAEQFAPGEFDLALSNPPYRPLSSGRLSPNPGLAMSRHEVSCRLSDVAGAAAYLLAAGGECCLVYPAARITALLAECRSKGLEPKALRLVHPRSESAPSQEAERLLGHP